MGEGHQNLSKWRNMKLGKRLPLCTIKRLQPCQSKSWCQFFSSAEVLAMKSKIQQYYTDYDTQKSYKDWTWWYQKLDLTKLWPWTKIKVNDSGMNSQISVSTTSMQRLTLVTLMVLPESPIVKLLGHGWPVYRLTFKKYFLTEHESFYSLAG